MTNPIDTKALRELLTKWKISDAEEDTLFNALPALLDRSDELDRVKAVAENLSAAHQEAEAELARVKSEGDSAAWLLEWPATEAFPLRWWQGNQIYTYDVHKAVRFVRREDAEVVKRTLKLYAQPVAHIWIGDRAIAAESELDRVKAERDEAR